MNAIDFLPLLEPPPEEPQAASTPAPRTMAATLAVNFLDFMLHLLLVFPDEGFSCSVTGTEIWCCDLALPRPGGPGRRTPPRSARRRRRPAARTAGCRRSRSRSAGRRG